MLSYNCVIFLTLVFSVVDAKTDYCRLSCGKMIQTMCLRKNVNCGPGPACGSSCNPISLTNEDRRLILDIHNELRNKVATGNENIGNQPPASDMNALSYNNELETIAQCWTNTCELDHDECRQTKTYKSVGQNIGIKKYSGTNELYRNVINSTIHSWYNEVKNFEAPWVSQYQRYGPMIGHYTQLVWAKSKVVGCGLTNYRDGEWNAFLFACNYGPGGNLKGTPIYSTEGTPASYCSGQVPNPKYEGLCGPDNLDRHK